MKRASVCLAFAFAVGCTEAPRSPTPGEGLTITGDPTSGITGTYAEGDVVVHFQTIQDEAGDGVSARWTDDQGYSIAIDFSGDPVAYQLWGDEAPPMDVRANRAALLDVVVRGSEALALVQLDGAAARQAEHVQALGAAIPPLDQRMLVATAAELAEIETDRQSGVIAYNTGTYKQWFAVIDSGVVGAHQCTAWSNYYLDTSGRWYFYNHLLNRNGHNDTPACDTNVCGAWSSPHGYKGSGKCSTAYQLCGVYDNRHNCRSDSKWQQNWVMRNTYCSKSGGICYHPQGLFSGASCSASTSCSSGYNLCL